jgi:hypothetical protein
MRRGRFLSRVIVVLVAGLVAVVAVQLAASATSRSSKSIPARVRALEAKVKALTASVNTLKGDVSTLQTREDCLGAQGVKQWGNPAASQGYLYTNDGVNVGATTAFDAPAQGQPPTFYAATVNPSCVTGSERSAFRLGHVAAHRSTALRVP